MTKKTIELKNVSKVFKDSTILNNINLKLEEKKIYGLIGTNGSGKSVLIKILSGLIFPSEGEVLINNKKANGEFKENIGVLFDQAGLLPQYSALDNLKLLASINNLIDEITIKEYLKLVGLNPNDNKKVKNFSLGMKQKAGIAAALMEDPDIILLDEPMNGLDSESVDNIRNILLSLKSKGKIILITSHNKDDIDLLCDTVFKLDNCRLSTIRTQKI